MKRYFEMIKLARKEILLCFVLWLLAMFVMIVFGDKESLSVFVAMFTLLLKEMFFPSIVK